MKLAAQMYSVRQFTQTPEDIVSSLRKIKQMGYDAVQISGFGKCDENLIKSVLDETGLKVCLTHAPLDEILHDTDRVIELHKLWGAPYVGLGYYGIYTAKDCDEFCEKIIPAAEKIRSGGLTLLYHNHSHEFISAGGEQLLDRVLKNVSPDIMGLTADMYWLQYAGVSPVEFLERYGDRCRVVHFKDMCIKCDDGKLVQHNTEILNGNMDYGAIYDACVKAGVEWAAVEHEENYIDNDPFKSMEASLHNLKSRGMF